MIDTLHRRIMPVVWFGSAWLTLEIINWAFQGFPILRAP